MINSGSYKSICNKPNSFRVSTLEYSLNVLRNENIKEASIIAKALLHGRIEKPDLHSGKARDDFCSVECTFKQADLITETLLLDEASSITNDGKATQNTANLVELVNVWSNYRDSLE